MILTISTCCSIALFALPRFGIKKKEPFKKKMTSITRKISAKWSYLHFRRYIMFIVYLKRIQHYIIVFRFSFYYPRITNMFDRASGITFEFQFICFQHLFEIVIMLNSFSSEYLKIKFYILSWKMNKFFKLGLCIFWKWKYFSYTNNINKI